MTMLVRRTPSAMMLALFAGIVVALSLAMALNLFGATAHKQVVSGLPLAAEYRTPVYVGDWNQPTYTGWATVHAARGAIDPGFSPWESAWKWTGTQWTIKYRSHGTRVWVAPFAGVWSWTWTSSTGWLAMRDNVLLVRWEPGAIAT